MMRLRAVAGTMVMVVLAIAAPVAQSDSAELLGRADVLLLTDNFAEARPLYEQALKNARAADGELEIARALLGLGQVSRRDGHRRRS